MKRKNLLKAKMWIDGIKIDLSCRKTSMGFRWYGNDGRGERLAMDESVDSINEAKSALTTTYPPRRYRMVASWLTNSKVMV